MIDDHQNEILKRFRQLVDSYSNRKAKFISDSKIGQSQLSETYDGKKSISPGIKLKLRKNLNVNIDWLETGEGEPYLQPEINKQDDKKEIEYLKELLKSKNEIIELLKKEIDNLSTPPIY